VAHETIAETSCVACLVSGMPSDKLARVSAYNMANIDNAAFGKSIPSDEVRTDFVSARSYELVTS
jgi:hypothetical protein